MKDTDKVELTVEAVKRAAEKCGTAKEILKELFPEVFWESPPEWENITTKCVIVPYTASCLEDDIMGIGVPMNDGDTPFYCPLVVVYNKKWGGKGFTKEGYPINSDGVIIKMEKGKIWRGKSA